MEMSLKTRNRAFILIEVIAAGLIILLLGLGVASIYVMEVGVLNQVMHQLDAINYARSVANTIIGLGEQNTYDTFNVPSSLEFGAHTDATDPDILTLPDVYFKTHLNGRISYTIDAAPEINYYAARRVTITIEWEENFPKAKNGKETIVFVIFPGAYYMYGV